MYEAHRTKEGRSEAFRRPAGIPLNWRAPQVWEKLCHRFQSSCSAATFASVESSGRAKIYQQHLWWTLSKQHWTGRVSLTDGMIVWQVPPAPFYGSTTSPRLRRPFSLRSFLADFMVFPKRYVNNYAHLSRLIMFLFQSQRFSASHSEFLTALTHDSLDFSRTTMILFILDNSWCVQSTNWMCCRETERTRVLVG